MLESGPPGGGSAWRRRFSEHATGSPSLLAFDMGGTTAKLSLVDGGEPLVAYGFEAARHKRFIEGSGLADPAVDNRADRDRRRRRQHRPAR